jgi:integrase
MPRTSNTIIRRPDGRYEARAMFGEMGRRRRRSFMGATPDEARRKLTAALSQQDAGQVPPPERESVAAYLRAWLAAKQPSLRAESYRRYREACDLHLVPQLGRVRLAKLTATQVEAAYAAIRAKGLSGTSLQLIHGVLRKALQDAMRRGEVLRNVATLVDTPKRSTPEMRVLNADEAHRLMDAARGDALEALYVLALTTGLRLGELQALRWQYVDLERRRLVVAATYQGNAAGQPVFAAPKTDKSRRTVVLPDVAIDALRRHRAAQLEHRLFVGSLWRDHDVVFASALGAALDGNNFRRRSFAPLLQRAELPPMRFHTLRHSAATLLMAAGVPVKVASEMLGHSDISTTLRVYSHVLEPMQDAAAAAMDDMFGEREAK